MTNHNLTDSHKAIDEDKNTHYSFGIIGAMEVEIKTLKEAMHLERTIDKAGMTFFVGTLGKTPCVVVKSGVAKVNAALCVQILVDDFHVSAVINTGVAGSLDNRLNIGDIVISDKACYHDVNATVFGYKPGMVPGMDLFFQADNALMKQVEEAVGTAAPDISYLVGTVCSGDQFIADKEQKDNIKKTFDGLCCEMEGAAIAHACCKNNIPFVIVRKISDKADGSDVMEYTVFEEKAAADCAAIVKSMLTD